MAYGEYTPGQTDTLSLKDGNGDPIAVDTWVSYNTAVATITAGGSLTAVAPGIAVVLAKDGSGNVIASDIVRVIAAAATARYGVRSVPPAGDAYFLAIGSPFTAVNRFTFSSDVRSNGNALNVGRWKGVAASNTTDAYVAGGNGWLSTGAKMTFSAGTWSASTSLSAGGESGMAWANATAIVYTIGYTADGNYGRVDRIAWSGMSRTSLTALGTARYGGVGVGNSTHAFIWTGVTVAAGYNTGNVVGVLDKYEFSSGTRVSTGTVGGDKVYSTALSSPTHGYNVGGYDGATMFRTANKLAFADNTVTTTGNLTSTGRWFMGQGAGNSTKGYVGGGNDGSNVATKENITFSSDTYVVGTSLSAAMSSHPAFSSSPSWS